MANTYTSGNCTWWVKQNASWWPNGAGNAKDWFPYAQSHGFQTSSNPQKGAIAVWDGGIDPPQGFGHVALVQDFQSDGTFTVSEMNWKGLGVVDTRNVKDRSHLLGFILAPGSSPSSGSSGPSDPFTALQNAFQGIGNSLQNIQGQFIDAGKVAGGGAIVIVGLLIAALLIARPGPLREIL